MEKFFSLLRLSKVVVEEQEEQEEGEEEKEENKKVVECCTDLNLALTISSFITASSSIQMSSCLGEKNWKNKFFMCAYA